MASNPMGAGISSLRRLSQSRLVNALHLHKPLEKLVFHGTKYSINSLEGFSGKSKGKNSAERMGKPDASKALFDITPTEDQTMFCDAVARLAADLIRPAASEADTQSETPAELLQQVHELGLTHFAIPEAFGGAASERSPLSQALVAEQLAHGDMGIAVAALAPMAVINALVDFGTAEQQSRYLPRFTEDKFVPAALAITEAQPMFDPRKLKTTAEAVADGFMLSGEKTLVPLAVNAELILVAAELPGKGPRLFIVGNGQEGVTIKPSPAMGLRAAALGTVTLNNVKVDADNLLGNDDFDYGKLQSQSQVAWSALATGCAQAMLDYVIPYVKERKAFGEPIAHRQAVAFLVANIGIELEGLRLMMLRAAGQLEQGDATQAARLAYIQAIDKGMEIGNNGVQLLGGHGFTKEHPAERWYRQMRGLAAIHGGVTV
ncbi:MAG: alkylation response protein AidB-like acyl-CoA dehydrogenase [Gammaproteobacteria bacterium]|jgi:alkylation response protein AidB-like acyl-CoA dehydrogenase